MKVENYIIMYNQLARSLGWNLIEQADGPHEKGKEYTNIEIKTFPFFFQ